jgi:ankyrin repeat protein
MISAGASEADVSYILTHHSHWIDEQDDDGWTSLMRAVESREFGVALQLLQHDQTQKLHLVNYLGQTALHLLLSLSAEQDHPIVAEFTLQLIKKEPKLMRIPDRKGETALTLAARSGHLSLLMSFLASIGDIAHGGELLHSAAAGNQVDTVQLLVNQLGVSMHVRNNRAGAEFDTNLSQFS